MWSYLKFSLILLIICWIVNLIYFFLFQSGNIHIDNVITLKSFVFTILVTLLLKKK
jgi:hypothetical protein